MTATTAVSNARLTGAGIAEVDVRLVVNPGADGVSRGNSIRFRYSDNSNFLFLKVRRGSTGTNQIEFWKREAGTTTKLGSTVTLAAGDLAANTEVILRVVASGSSLTGYLNGVQKIATTSSFNQTATGVGLTFEETLASGQYVDGFEVWSLGTGTDTTAPSVPTGLSASAVSASQINLAWTASTDATGVQGYKIYRGGTYLASVGPVGSVAFSDTGLTAATAYSYTVGAIDGAANASAQSGAAAATTQPATDTTAPSIPAGLAASAPAANQVNLSWTAATDNVGVTRYSIYRGGTLLSVVAGTVTAFTDRSTAASTAYSYTVKASDAAANTSAASSAANVTTPSAAATGSTYGYDRLYRLTSATEPITGPTTYGYDPAGNRLSRVRGTTTTYTYDRADRISAAGALALTTNANGNTTARGTDTFTYDGANRLKTATVAGVTEAYAYDGDGVRFSRTVGANPAIGFISDVNAGLPVTLDDGPRKYVYGLGLAFAVSASTLEVYHADRLGSIRVITNAAGTVTATYRTDEFGVPTAATGTSTQPFRYTGEPLDARRLTYLRARYYDPSLGRFMSRDSWPGSRAVPASLNRSVYVQNGPATYSDPSGRCVDPGGPGIRYCIDRFIPGADVGLFDGGGDNRGANPSGGTFRIRQLISNQPDGTVAATSQTGVSSFFGTLSEGSVADCGAAAESRVKSRRTISVTCRGVNGVLPFFPEIFHLLQIHEGPGGAATVDFLQSSIFPSIEIWQYGGADGPSLVYYYDASPRSILDLPTVDVLVAPR